MQWQEWPLKYQGANLNILFYQFTNILVDDHDCDEIHYFGKGFFEKWQTHMTCLQIMANNETILEASHTKTFCKQVLPE